MKPGFALNLSHDGIGLLRRTATGWETLGEVPLDSPDLSGRLADLRDRAAVDGPVASKIVIPGSQVLYTTIRAPGPDPEARRAQIAAALDGMTPYAVADLVFDWCGEGETVQVAVVARETLREAECFAEDWGFHPVSFGTIPEPGQFTGEPWFGLSTPEAQADRDPLPLQVQTDTPAAEPEDNAFEPPEDTAPPEAPECNAGPETPENAPEGRATDSTPDAAEAPGTEGAPDAPPDMEPEAAPPENVAEPSENDTEMAPGPEMPPNMAVPAEEPVPQDALLSEAPQDTTPSMEDEPSACEEPELPLAGAAPAEESVPQDTPPAPQDTTPSAEDEPSACEEPELPLASAAPAEEPVPQDAPPPETAEAPPQEILPPPAMDAEDSDEALAVVEEPVPEREEPEPPKPTPVPPAPLTAVPAGRFADPSDHRAPALPGVARGAVRSGVAQRPARSAAAQRVMIGLTAGLVLALLTASLWASRAEDAIPVEAPVVADIAPQIVDPELMMPEWVVDAALTVETPAGDVAPEPPIVLAANDIVPTAKGVVTPQGITLYSGRPPQAPKPRPEGIAETAAQKSRPEAPQPEPADPALAGVRPKPRPMAVISAGETTRQAEAETEGATEQAVSVSRRPVSRPRNYRQSVEQALAAAIASEPVPPAPRQQPPAPVVQPAPAPVVQPAPQRQQPRQPAVQQPTARDPVVVLDEPEPTQPTRKAPTSASVAKQATQKDAIRLKEMNLIGLYGAQGSRRALIRMPSGKMIKVGVGDALDGGRVTAIGEGQLTYQKGSRLYQLKLLQGS
ncbi:hypothetical protein [Paenirhodobacter sp.]|uniref:hypothetical protein n=1 Tax=Paenirhodobacter sp. TaxID=1965326 RepID=UPI003B3EB446